MITTETRDVAWNLIDGNVMTGAVLRKGHDLLTVARPDGTSCHVPTAKVRDATADDIRAARLFYGLADLVEQPAEVTALPDWTTYDSSVGDDQPADATGLDALTHHKLMTAIRQHDEREARGRRYNANAFAIYCRALQTVDEDMAAGASLARALYDSFQDRLLTRLEQAVSLPVTYGGGAKSTGRPA
jgi:hypothetical protein